MEDYINNIGNVELVNDIDDEIQYIYDHDIEIYKMLINKNYFFKNKQKVINRILDAISKSESFIMEIMDKELLTDEILTLLAKSSFETVILAPDEFTLNKKFYDLFAKNDSIIYLKTASIDNDIYYYNPVLEVKNIPEKFMGFEISDGFIDYNCVINSNLNFDETFKIFENNKFSSVSFDIEEYIDFSHLLEKLHADDIFINLEINETFNSSNLKALKNIFENYNINRCCISFSDNTYKQQILEIVSSAEKIELTYVDEFSEENNVFDGEPKMAINMYNDKEQDIIEREKLYNNIISEVKSYNLSPLEEYMYLYNIVKNFMEYKESNHDSKLSRSTSEIYKGNYIVCVGYANLLCELVRKLNDSSLIASQLKVDVITYNGREGHLRCILKIKDEKYGIDGVYISDPTWDSVKYDDFEDNYNYFLMSYEEVDNYYLLYNVSDYLFNREGKSDYSKSIQYSEDSVLKTLQAFNAGVNEYNMEDYIKTLKSNPIPKETINKCKEKINRLIYFDNYSVNDDNQTKIKG